MKQITRLIIKFLFFYLFFYIPLDTYSQGNLSIQSVNDIKLKRFTDEQGLSSRFGVCILQDTYGFIWFGTQIGLNRYDGYDIISFVTDNTDPTSLPHNQLWSLYEDKSKGLWICSEGGLSSYNRASRTFTNYYPDRDNPVAPDNTIYSIKEDSRGTYWVFTKAGLYSFDKGTKTFKSFKHDSILSKWSTDKEIIVGNEIRYFEDSSGTIWIGTMQGLKVFNHPELHSERYKEQDNRYSGEFQTFKYNSDNPQSLSNDTVSCIIEDKNGTIWISTFGGGLNRLIDKEKGLFKHYRFKVNDSKSIINDYLIPLYIDTIGNLWIGGVNGFSKYNYETDDFSSYKILSHNHDFNERINVINEDKSGKIWLTSSYTGAFSFNPITNSIVNYKNNPKNPYSLSSDDVLNIFIDRANSVWVVTEGGFNKIDFTLPPFKHYTSNPFDPNTLSHNNVRGFCKDRSGNLWIATLGGGVNKLIIYTNGKEEFIHYKHNSQDINSLSENDVYVVYEDKCGILWFGTYRKGLNRFDPKTETFTRYIHDENNPKSISDGRIRAIYEDSRGMFWIGLQNGLDIMDRSTGEFKHFKAKPDDKNSLPDEYVHAFFEDNRGTLWLGSFFGGFCRYNRETNDFTVYQNEPGNIESLSDNCVRQIYEDRAGRFWLGTFEGLNLFDRDTENFTLFSKKDGFEGEYLKGLLEDEHGNLWISSNRGITKFNYDNGIIMNYDMDDGVQGFEFNLNSYYKAQTGEMYFGGFNGYNVFNPSNIKDNPYIPQIVITDIKIFNKSILSPEFSMLDKSISETEKIRISHNQNFLSFEFASLNYTNSLKNQYKYRMIGIDPDTVYAKTKRYAEYPNMRPGKYTFWVTGSNNDGVWNEDGISIKIIIYPPLLKTKLAYVLYFLVLIFLVYLIIRWRIVVRDKSMLEVQVKERTRQINDQKEELQQQKEELQITLENLKTTQSQLVQSEKMASLGGLVAGVAHEINTPVGIGITAVSSLIEDTKNMAELYKKDQISRGDFKEFLQTTNNSSKLIQKNLERTASLVQSFKQVSVDQSTEQQREFYLKAYLEDVIRSLYPKLKQRDIDINIECDEKLQLNSYPGTFAQIFTNLVLNSIAHGFKEEKSKGVIDILVKQEAKQIQIEYKDNGEGISHEILPKIFDPFFTTDQSKGTGLGLNIIYNLVTQKLKGSIKCESEEKKGAVFRIVVPVEGKRE